MKICNSVASTTLVYQISKMYIYGVGNILKLMSYYELLAHKY